MSRQAIEDQLQMMPDQLGEPLQSPVRYALRGGKRARGLLLLAAGESSDTKLVRAAACVELLHAATLVQDDIFDRSRVRRGAASVYCAYGAQLATLASDWMLSEATRSAYRLAPGFGEALSGCAQKMMEAEALELAPLLMQTPVDLRAHAESVARGKTGELFGLALSAAALLGGDQRRAAELYQAGCRLGVAFQYLDDVLDLYGEADCAGKSLGRDLAASLCTLPALDASARLPASMAAPLLGRAGEIPGAVLEELGSRGVRDYVMVCARGRWEEALQEISRYFSEASDVMRLLGSLATAVLPDFLAGEILPAA
jgi:geranylgeranyl pyrophosphate synthase